MELVVGGGDGKDGVTACSSDCKNYIVSKTMIENLTQTGFTFDPSVDHTYDEVIGSLSVIYLGMANNLRTSLNNYDSLECDKWLGEMSKCIGAIKDVELELTKTIDAEYAAARENLRHENKHIWEIIPTCLAAAANDKLDRFNNSLHDWWGAKKYIMAAICLIDNIPIIVATFGGGTFLAIGNMVLQFFDLMLGEWDFIEDIKNFGECLANESR
jgi:hypothetical protein